jgi:hypothetical protein
MIRPASFAPGARRKEGVNRTGTMVAVYRMQHDGLTGEAALEEMKTFGFDPEKYPAYASFVLGFKPTPAADRP